MRALFELKKQASPDLTVFNCMHEAAMELLSHSEKSQYTQAIVLRSVKGNEYSAVIRNALSEDKTDEKSLICKIQETKDSEICFALCMWQDNCIDIPSYAFRKLLINSNAKNADMTLFVMTAEGVGEIKLSTTMR